MRDVQTGTPGRVFENLIILGSAPGEGYGSPPATSAPTTCAPASSVWTSTPSRIPASSATTPGRRTPGSTSAASTPGARSPSTRSAASPTSRSARPTYDFYGADRNGANLFGNCLLALDARTGKRLWHFQAVHHDLWDYDLATAPKLLTVQHNGKTVDVVAQATKFGFLYVFDRVTGEPLWPIEERPVPQSDVPGEKSLADAAVPDQAAAVRAPDVHRRRHQSVSRPGGKAAAARHRRERAQRGPLHAAERKRDRSPCPARTAAANWGGAAADPATGMVYVRSLDAPTMHKLTQTEPRIRALARGNTEQQGYAVYLQHCLTCHGGDRARITYPKEIDAARFKTTVRSGKGEMPAFSEDTLGAQAFDNLAAYLRNPAAIDAPIAGRGGAP